MIREMVLVFEEYRDEVAWYSTAVPFPIPIDIVVPGRYPGLTATFDED